MPSRSPMRPAPGARRPARRTPNRANTLDPFTQAYIETALRSLRNPKTGRPYRNLFTLRDLAPETLAAIQNDCASFQRKYGRFFKGREVEAGVQFWIVRNGNLVFLEADWPKNTASILTDGAEAAGAYRLTVHRGKVYGSYGDDEDDDY